MTDDLTFKALSPKSRCLISEAPDTQGHQGYVESDYIPENVCDNCHETYPLSLHGTNLTHHLCPTYYKEHLERLRAKYLAPGQGKQKGTCPVCHRRFSINNRHPWQVYCSIKSCRKKRAKDYYARYRSLVRPLKAKDEILS